MSSSGTGHRLSVAKENETPNTKRVVSVGDPVPLTPTLPTSGESPAASSRGAVGSAVYASREHLHGEKKAGQSMVDLALDDNFFYDKSAFTRKDVSAKQMDPNSLTLCYSYGFESNRRNNLHYLNEYTVATAVGNVLVFINLRTLDQDYMPGLRDGAIGSIAVHPTRRYIAVGEMCDDSPSIYIFEYPSLKLYRVMRDGAERGYSNLCFNATGDKLASVGMDPDYMLTIWNWKQEKVVLRSKAFSQDIFHVSFSPESDGQLTTSGMGHIKFWRMAHTFTGLKLQGYVGKFGLTELTDIVTFIQLPDGKVLSSTETGNLLLWDGGMIKCEISGKGKKPCHQGRVEFITMVEGEVFTAGEDGYVRIWDFETIDTADVVTTGAGSTSAGTSEGGNMVAGPASTTQARVFEVEPLDEILIGKDVRIRTMVRCPTTTTEYLVQDQSGNLFKLDTQKRSAEKIMSFHSGGVASVDASPLAHAMASLGGDGTLRLHDYISKTTTAVTKYPTAGTVMTYLPESLEGRGCTLAAGFADGVLRIVSHTPLSMGDDAHTFNLQYAFKPHKAPITAIGISADGTYLATTSLDKTIFFFKINAIPPVAVSEEQPPVIFSKNLVKIVPIGFLSVSAVPTKVAFSPDNHQNIEEIEPVDDDGYKDTEANGEDRPKEEDITGKRALFVLENGELYSLTVPPPEDVDNSLSFMLHEEQLQVKRWTLDVPIPEPILTPSRTEGDETPSLETKESAIVQDTAKVNGRLTSAARKAHGLVIDHTCPITNVMYLEGGYILLALVNKDGESEIRACKLGTPKQSRLVLVYKANITDMRLSTSGKYLLVGALNGMTCLRKFRLEDILLYRWTGGHEAYSDYSKAFEEEEASAAVRRKDQTTTAGEADSRDDLSRFVDVPGQYWFGHVHNGKLGRVTSVVVSFDDSFLASSGLDGGLFVWRVTIEDIKSNEAYEAPEYGEVEQTDMIDDILDPNAYALEDAKLKSEKDKEYDDAQKKKQVTRDYVQELRNEFLKLVAENEKVPIHQQISRASLTIDPDLHSDIEKETEEKIHLVRKELEWISEKESIVPNKLRRKFLDPLQTERIEIQAFKTRHAVATLRTTKLEQTVEVVQPLTTEGRSSRTLAREQSAAHGQRKGDTQTPPRDSRGEPKRVGKALDPKSKLEARKQLRAERAAMWKELMDAKPDENYEDPKDVAAIRYAEQHMGDYKLKTGEKYIVPENERVDADKKRRQILLLKESIFTLKEQFNHKVLSLRSRKMELIGQIQEQNGTLESINSLLAALGTPVRKKIWQPLMEASAYPENRFQVTPIDIAQFQKADLQAAAVTKANADDFMGGFGSSVTQGAPAGKSRPGTVGTGYHTPLTRGPSRVSMANATRSSTTLTVATNEAVAVPTQNKSALELKEQEIQIKELQYRRERLLSAIDDAVKDFDTSLYRLVKEKIVLEADLKSADMKLLLLYKEWVLLKEFEKHDNALADKLAQKRMEKDEIDAKIKECQEKLNGKKAEIEQVISKEKDIQEEFRLTLGENNKYEEMLTKMFRKKIKRTKKKQKTDLASSDQDGADSTEVDDEDDIDDEDDLDDFDDEESVSDENDNDGSEECPHDYDPASFAKILSLREQRLDQDDILAEIQKAVDALKKENDSLLKKEKIIDQALRATETEIQEFQTQKQQKLNELDVIVTLHLHQIQFTERGALPADLGPALVFVNEGLLKLRNRIKELQQEKSDIRKQHKELRKMHVNLVKSRKEKQLKLQELEARAVDVQMLKFGHIIDLEKLERMGVNRNADELREKLAKEDAKRLKEVEALESEINRLKEELTEATRENTVRLESLVDLTDAKQKLEADLNAAQLSVTAEYSGPQHKDIVERQTLISLVHTQATEIDELKQEIEMLIRKPIRQLPPILQNRREAPPIAGSSGLAPKGGLVTGEGMVVGAHAVPNAADIGIGLYND